MKCLSFLAITVLFAVTAPLGAGDIKPWPHPFMQADAITLTTAAKTRYAEDDHQQMWREIRYDIDAEGRRNHTERWVLYLADHTALETYSHLTTTWLPWYQTRPQLRARVVHPDGTIYELDPADIVEGSATQSDADQFNEARRLTAPLPRLMVGAVIETEIVQPAVRPIFAAGDAWPAFFATAPFPQQVIVTTPNDAPLKVVLDPSFEALHQSERQDGRTIQTWTLTKAAEPMTTDEHARLQSFTRGRLVFGTGESWHQVGAAYGSRVAQIAVLDDPPFDLQALVEPGDARTTAARFLREIQKTVRYTGLYLGDKNFIPTPPAEVLNRGFGDCKDTAVLLTAMLRKVGFHAQLALVNSAERDLPAGAPGLGIFNHVIVLVRGERPLWIDTTVTLNRDATLPFELHGTQALIADKDGGRWVTIDDADPALHGVTYDMAFTANLNQSGLLKITSQMTGNNELKYRHHFRDKDPNNLNSTGRFTELSRLAFDDFTRPWTHAWQLEGRQYCNADFRGTVVTMPMDMLLAELPQSLIWDSEAPPTPLFLADAGTFRFNYHFNLPDGYHLVAPFPDLSFDAPHLNVVHEPHPEDPNRGQIVMTLHSGRLESEELSHINEWFVQMLKSNQTQVYYHQAYQLFLSDTPEASFAALADALEAQPSFANHMRLALNFSEWGMVEAVATQVAQALAQPHTEEDALAACALLLKNHEGQELGIGYPRDHALRLLDQEVARFPEKPMLAFLRAVIRDHNTNGMMLIDAEQLALSGADYARLGRENMSPKQADLYLWNRLWAGDLETAQLLGHDKDFVKSSALHVTVVAIQHGADQALALMARMNDQSKHLDILSEAFDNLSTLRYFDEAMTLLTGGLSTDHQQRIAEKLKKWRARRRDQIQSWRENDPRTPILRLALNQLTPYGDKPFSEQQIFCEAPARAFTQLRRELNYLGFGIAKGALSSAGASQLGIWESFLPTFQVEVVAEAPNHKKLQLVKLSIPMLEEKPDTYYWVVRDRAGYRLAGNLHSIYQIVGAMEHAVTHKQIKPAVKMLEYLLAKEQEHLWGHKSSNNSAMWSLLKQHNKKAFHDLLVILGGKTKDPERVFPRLTELALNCDNKALAKQLIRDISQAQIAHDQIDAGLATAEAFYQKDPTEDRALALLQRYREAERFEEHAALLAELKTKTDVLSPKFRGENITALKAQGHLQEVKLLQEHECNAYPDDDVVGPNNFAWLHLFLDDADLNAAVARIENFQQTSGSAASQHTLATLYATLGRNQDAITTLKKSVKTGVGHAYDSDDFYVLGRVAENLGFRDIARSYYTRVEIQEDVPLATEKLARKRLTALADADTDAAATIQ